jgi:hypothetical protein
MRSNPIILLFGMPRSGTTWIGKIFDSHHKTLYRHEPDTWNKIREIPLLAETASYQQYCQFLNMYVESFTNSTRPEVNGKRPLFPKSYASPIRHLFFRSSVYASALVSKVNKGMTPAVVRPFNKRARSNFTVVWKSIQLLGRFGVIVNCLDRAKGVHILRHPCGYISSVLEGERSRKFTSFTSASEDYPLFEQLMNAPQAKRYELDMESLKSSSPEERLAWRWVLFNEKALDDTHDNPNVKIMKYENMCESPLETAKSYFKFCGLDWCDQTEEFLTSSTTRNSSSYYSVYKNPNTASAKWKRSLSAEQISRVERVISQSRIGEHYKNCF